MKQRPPIYYSQTQKALMWERWKKGESLQQIAQLFDRDHSSVHRILAETGGIRPPERHRSQLALTLAEREEISRAVVAGQSIRSVATLLGRAPSTISREINRNGGADCYRAAQADKAAWDRALRPKTCKLVGKRKLANIVAGKLQLQWSPQQTTLKLKVNLAKSKVAPMSECAFLGFTIKGKKIRWTDKVLADFKHRIKELTGRSWGVSMEYRLRKLGQYLRGWTAYFGISQYYRPVPELDEWIRRRIRMCYWKQWRWARTRIKNLLALGVSLKSAIQHGVSSNRYWQMSRTPVINQAISNAWLNEQGLLSVKDLWCKAQGYTAKKKSKTSSSVPTC